MNMRVDFCSLLMPLWNADVDEFIVVFKVEDEEEIGNGNTCQVEESF